jgi:hypothetical protein
MTKKDVTIYPVEGRYITGVAAVETTTDADTAAKLVETGAFTTKPPKKPAEPAETPEE